MKGGSLYRGLTIPTYIAGTGIVSKAYSKYAQHAPFLGV